MVDADSHFPGFLNIKLKKHGHGKVSGWFACWWCIDLILIGLMQNNVDEAVKKLKAQGIEAMGVVCHVSNAQHRKNLIEKTVQVSGIFVLLSCVFGMKGAELGKGVRAYF